MTTRTTRPRLWLALSNLSSSAPAGLAREFRLVPGAARQMDGCPQIHATLLAGTRSDPETDRSADMALMMAMRDGRACGLPSFDVPALFIVQAWALPGQGPAFEAFYAEPHLREITGLDGFLSGALFSTTEPGGYVSVWELSDAALAAATLSAARQASSMTTNPASDLERTRSGFYQRIG